MIYIPNEWIVKSENKDKVFKILNRLDKDIVDRSNYSVNDAINDLVELGEMKIIEKLRDNAFSFGA